MSLPQDKAARIAGLNDLLRADPNTGSGHVFFTPNVTEKSAEDQIAIYAKVRLFDDFTDDNDPYGEHDFGAFTYNGEKFFWKIDYYAPDMLHGSEDPSDPDITCRVLTVMCANEY